MSELYFVFQGNNYTATLIIRNYYSEDYYYVALLSEELIKRFSISYIFAYSKTTGLQDVSTDKDPKNDELVEALSDALKKYIGI